MDSLGSGRLNGVPKARFKLKAVEKDWEMSPTRPQDFSPILAHPQRFRIQPRDG